MENMSISKQHISKIINDFEVLLDDLEVILSKQDVLARKRIEDIKNNPSIGKTERELDEYLKARGVKVGRLDNKRTS